MQTFDAIGPSSGRWRISIYLGQRIASCYVARRRAALTSFENAIDAEAGRFVCQCSARFLPAHPFHEDRTGQPEKSWERRSVIENRVILHHGRYSEVTPVSDRPRTAGVTTELRANELCILVRVRERY